MATLISRNYQNFAGIDFSSDASKVQLNRSPDSVNMYKNYASTQGKCIETRPGYSLLGKIGTTNNYKINGIYFFETGETVKTIVHSGTNLYNWVNFPTAPTTGAHLVNLNSALGVTMTNNKTKFFTFAGYLYIKDGTNYLRYDGTTLTKVATNATIPTTTIGRSPTGGGTTYQDINLLQPARKNTFIGNGSDTVYYLDTTGLDTYAEVVTVNGTALVEGVGAGKFTVDTTLGKITFGTAPSAPATAGQSNVEVTFAKTISGYADRINNCLIAETFDNRVFFSGNSTYQNYMFHSELNDPTYIRDLAYYEDGIKTTAIKTIIPGNNTLWVIKESSQQNATIFYHIPTLDYEYGKIYPSKQGNVANGCNSVGINFNDDIVYMSKRGLEGISGDIQKEQSICHRSTLVDSKMVNEANFNLCELQEWNGYLLCLLNGHIYLADSRQKYQTIDGFEYEWYYWENILYGTSNARIIKEYRGDLYFGCEDGNVLKFTGTNDAGQVLLSNWSTPSDTFDLDNRLKTTNKRGGIAKIKMIPNGQVKLEYKTNKTSYKYVTSFSTQGFSYTGFKYTGFTYKLGLNSYIVYKIKGKNINDITLNFYTDVLDKPFGLYNATLEAFIGGYIKK